MSECLAKKYKYKRFKILKHIFRNGKFSVLDLAGANGIVSLIYRDNIKLYHGFDIAYEMVKSAKSILYKTKIPEYYYGKADLRDWNRFKEENDNILLESYDVVLFLGIFNKLYSIKKDNSYETFDNSIRLAKTWYVIRTPKIYKSRCGVVERIEKHGFKLCVEENPTKSKHLGWAGVFRRKIK